MKFRIMLFALLCSLVFAFSACSDEPPTPGVLTAFDQVCNEANDGKRIAVEGYLTLPDSLTDDDSSMVLRLFETYERDGQAIGTSVTVGREPNTVTMVGLSGGQYSDTDLIYRTSDDTLMGYSEKIRLSGTMYVPTSLLNLDFPCGLSNPLIERILDESSG